MRHLLFSAVALLAFAAPAHAETVAISGGRVVIGDGSAPIEGGTVVLRDGAIVDAGSNVAIPAGARTIDATGKWVTPGIFALRSPAFRHDRPLSLLRKFSVRRVRQGRGGVSTVQSSGGPSGTRCRHQPDADTSGIVGG